MRAKAAEDLADDGDVAGAAIVQARNKFLTQVNCCQPWEVRCSLCSSLGVIPAWTNCVQCVRFKQHFFMHLSMLSLRGGGTPSICGAFDFSEEFLV